MKIRRGALIALLANAIAFGFAATQANATPSDESEVRGTIQRVFELVGVANRFSVTETREAAGQAVESLADRRRVHEERGY